MPRVPPHPARRQRGRGRPRRRRARRRRRPHASRSPRRTHLPPVIPSKIICVHLNYRSRVEEMLTTLPPAPTYFHKPVSSLNAHDARGRPAARAASGSTTRARSPSSSAAPCRNISPGEAGDYIRGYTIANDYGLHDFRDTDAGSMLRVKGADTLCPLGPGIVEGWDFHGKRMRTHRQRRGRAGRQHRRDEVGHALPRRRHRPHHHPAPRRRAAVGHPGELPHGLSGRRRRGRGRGPRHAAQPHRRRARPRSAPTSARSPPRARRCSRPPWAATGSSAASASPTCPIPTDRRTRPTEEPCHAPHADDPQRELDPHRRPQPRTTWSPGPASPRTPASTR